MLIHYLCVVGHTAEATHALATTGYDIGVITYNAMVARRW
jgi:hypothetical protein